MKINIIREDVEKIIHEGFVDLAFDSNKNDEFIKRMADRNYNIGDIVAYINNTKSISLLNEFNLLVILIELYQTLNKNKFNPNRYFNENEIEQAIHYAEVLPKELNKITFKNMLPKTPNQWLGIIKTSEIQKLINQNYIQYNFDTQREASFSKYRGEIIKRPTINSKSVIEISERMLNKTYVYDTISLNILNEPNIEGNYPSFDIVENTNGTVDIIIPKETTLDLIDGMHRVKATEKALLDNPKLEGVFGLELFNMNIQQANNYIVQVDKRNPLDKKHIKVIDSDNNASRLVNRLNSDSNSYMEGQINDDFVVESNKALVSTNDMINIIDELWNLKNKNKIEVDMIYRDLLNGLNNIILDIPSLYVETGETVVRNNYNNPKSFILYLTAVRFNMVDSVKNVRFANIPNYIYNVNTNNKNDLKKSINYYKNLLGGENNEF